MSSLLLEPCYSDFHRDLMKSLGGSCYVLIFNLGYVIYTKGMEKKYLFKEINGCSVSQVDLDAVAKARTLYSVQVNPSEQDNYFQAQYISYLRAYIRDNNIQLVVMHNDLRWQHALAIMVCKELGIFYVVTERGLFRPNTTTLDFKGVNANSSLNTLWDKKKLGYLSRSTELMLNGNDEFKQGLVDKYKTYSKFGLFIMLNKLGDLLGLNAPLKNKEYSLRGYVRLYLAQLKSPKNSVTPFELPERYLFVPLQVATDTQILIHSDFDSVQSFIEFVESAFYNLPESMRNGCQLVFKKHPMEEGIVEYDFHSQSIISTADTGILVDKSLGVITINSTVGFEALCAKKPLIILGRAFYKISDIAFCLASVSGFKAEQQLSDSILQIINGKGPELLDNIESFVEFVKVESQVDGDLFNYSARSIEQAKRRILNHFSG